MECVAMDKDTKCKKYSNNKCLECIDTYSILENESNCCAKSGDLFIWDD